MDTNWHTIAEAAEMLGVSESWLRKQAHVLPHHRFGRTLKFNDGDIAAIIAMHEHRPVAEPAQRGPIPVGGRRRRQT